MAFRRSQWTTGRLSAELNFKDKNQGPRQKFISQLTGSPVSNSLAHPPWNNSNSSKGFEILRQIKDRGWGFLCREEFKQAMWLKLLYFKHYYKKPAFCILFFILHIVHNFKIITKLKRNQEMWSSFYVMKCVGVCTSSNTAWGLISYIRWVVLEDDLCNCMGRI